MEDWTKTKYEPPRKPDWLDRAREPNKGGWQAIQFVAATVLLVACVIGLIVYIVLR